MSMTFVFNPDATYDVQGEGHVHPLYRTIERRFYNASDRLPDGTYRSCAGIVALTTLKVMAGSTMLGVIDGGEYIRGDGERFNLRSVD